MVYLRENDNLSTGGVVIDVTDEVHEQNKTYSAIGCRYSRADVAGVDVSTVDISRPRMKQEEQLK